MNVFTQTIAQNHVILSKQYDKTYLSSVLHDLVVVLFHGLSVGVADIHPLALVSGVCRLPVSTHVGDVLGNVGATCATEPRLNATLVSQVSNQLIFVHVSLVTVRPRTRVVTLVLILRIGDRGERLESVDFERSTSSIPGLFRVRSGLRGTLTCS